MNKSWSKITENLPTNENFQVLFKFTYFFLRRNRTGYPPLARGGGQINNASCHIIGKVGISL